MSADLHWFPFYAKDFTASPTVQRMTDAQVGRYVLLLARAWDEGDVEPSLLAADFRGVSRVVKKQFQFRDGRFYHYRLSEIWREAQTRHAKAVARAQKAGIASGRKRQANSKSTPSSLGVNHAPVIVSVVNQKDSLGPVVGEAGALAAAAPRAAELPIERGIRNAGQPKRLPDAEGILKIAGVSR